eukprot:jgi/Chlat1/5227/Chrsp33S05078
MAGDDQEERVLSVSCGASHTIALLNCDMVCSWGRGEDGQLGHGDPHERSLPATIAALINCKISAVVCGADHTIAISKQRRQVYSWGWGDFGRLGHGNSSDVFIPQPVQLFSGIPISNIVCGDCHCMALTPSGVVYSWGRNQNGQLGIGNTMDQATPTIIPYFKDKPVAFMGCGAEHSVAADTSGKVYGNLGLGDREDRHTPHSVPGMEGENIKIVACGWRHTIAVTESGSLYTFGWSKYGQLGHGNFDDHLTPHVLEALRAERISQVAGGWRHTVALTDEGKLYSWGWNKFGQLGVGNNDDQCSPQLVSTLANESPAMFTHGEEAQMASLVLAIRLTGAVQIPPGDRYMVVPHPGPNNKVSDAGEVPSIPVPDVDNIKKPRLV